ncbi:CPBP family intramembrane glutamic endopeptidase [Desulfuribacillus alkaliarsenatis]|uniref:Abortive infection protein n=1 Tax=Desulfuribacillus alkaliarsenatis TaxID=766136 RepID=A0A1E5G386_9FIRM|nr:type II CAAX endopeptidase family protein [Desulfuribacillus alkaliarsenatis]OEF97430.1 abortive infection protein [Desulfuribacillus alkaliarsenatis]
MNKYKKAIVFTGLTYVISFVFISLFFMSGGQWGSASSIGVAMLYMAIPMIVAVFLQKLVYKEPVVKTLGISFKLNRWFLVAWLLTPVIIVLTIGVSLLVPGVYYDPSMEGMFAQYESTMSQDQLEVMREQIAALPIHYFWIGIIQGLIAGITINAIVAFGEEAGWRGFLQRELADMGFWKSSFVIGIVWGFWHAPLILQGHNYPNYPVIGVFMMVIFTLLWSPIFSYIRLKARSVIAASVLHGTINASLILSFIMVSGGHELLIGALGLAGFIVLAMVNVAIYIYEKRFTNEPIDTSAYFANEEQKTQPQNS